MKDNDGEMHMLQPSKKGGGRFHLRVFFSVMFHICYGLLQ